MGWVLGVLRCTWNKGISKHVHWTTAAQLMWDLTLEFETKVILFLFIFSCASFLRRTLHRLVFIIFFMYSHFVITQESCCLFHNTYIHSWALAYNNCCYWLIDTIFLGYRLIWFFKCHSTLIRQGQLTFHAIFISCQHNLRWRMLHLFLLLEFGLEVSLKWWHLLLLVDQLRSSISRWQHFFQSLGFWLLFCFWLLLISCRILINLS